MTDYRVEQQQHGYVGGHQLLASSVALDRADQDLVDRLSDIGGQPGPHEKLPDYLTGYPLPSGRFFAFARTWYDASAPRAGCVLTHTLLLPTAAWSGAPSIAALAELHHGFDRTPGSASLPSLPAPATPRGFYPPASGSGLAELAEALFLEPRQPIVWFADAEETAVLRIVEALWPALRVRFAFQTYALKPRRKADGAFDLMVAPRSARGRFSTWSGRRVDGDAPARHAFTPFLVEAVFEAPHPTLKAADPLGILRSDTVGDPAKLRLSMLWASLGAAEPRDPNTALGMLDVLSAAALPTKARWKLAEPLFRQIFNTATISQPRATPMIGLALGKLEPGDAKRLAPFIEASMVEVSKADPEGVLRLANSTWRDASAVPVLVHALARSLAAASPTQVWDTLRDALPDLADAILRIEPSLVLSLADHRSDDPADWAWFAARLLDLDPALLDRFCGAILDHVRTGAQAAVLEALLLNPSRETLTSVIERLAASGALDDRDLVMSLAQLEPPSHEDKLAAVAAARLPAAPTKALLEALLLPKRGDIDWLLAAELPPSLKADLLCSLLEQTSRSERRRRGLTDWDRLDPILGVLFVAGVGDALAAELLTDDKNLSDATFSLALDHYGSGLPARSDAVVAGLIEALVPLRTPSDVYRLALILETAVAPEAVRFVAPSIVDLLIPERVRDEETTYALGLVLAAELHGQLRRDFIAGLAIVAARSSSNRVYKLAPQAYAAWATLVDAAIKMDSEVGETAASSAIAYSIRRSYDTLLPLVRTSFSTAFNATLKRSKKGRRGAEEMAKDVGRLFVSNRWDGLVLVEMILKTDDSELAIGAISDIWNGRDFLSRSIERYDRILADRGT